MTGDCRIVSERNITRMPLWLQRAADNQISRDKMQMYQNLSMINLENMTGRAP